MVTQELVSVYIATRNRAELLERAVKSVLAQDYKNIEIVIVSDGSSDNTDEVVHGFAGLKKRIIYSKFENSKGACVARNRAIELSSGVYITGLDDDDIYLPNHISGLVNGFNENYSLISSSCGIDNGKKITSQFKKKSIVSFEDIKSKNYVGNQALTLRTRLQSVGGYDEALKAWQDYDLWLRLIEIYGPAKLLNNYSYIVNVNEDRERITNSKNAFFGYKQFIKKHRDKLSINDLRCQEINDLYNRKVDISIFKALKMCKSWWMFKRLLKLLIQTRMKW